jgi:hypothetical protein
VSERSKRNIPIARFDPRKDEQTAQAYEDSCLRQLSAIILSLVNSLVTNDDFAWVLQSV